MVLYRGEGEGWRACRALLEPIKPADGRASPWARSSPHTLTPPPAPFVLLHPSWTCSSSGDDSGHFLAPSLTHLCLRDATLLGETAFDALASMAGGLRDLCLHGCRGLTDAGLAALSGLSCPNLRWLNTVGAYKLTSGAERCLLASHPALLLYCNPDLFAVEAHEGPDDNLLRRR